MEWGVCGEVWGRGWVGLVLGGVIVVLMARGGVGEWREVVWKEM